MDSFKKLTPVANSVYPFSKTVQLLKRLLLLEALVLERSVSIFRPTAPLAKRLLGRRF